MTESRENKRDEEAAPPKWKMWVGRSLILLAVLVVILNIVDIASDESANDESPQAASAELILDPEERQARGFHCVEGEAPTNPEHDVGPWACHLRSADGTAARYCSHPSIEAAIKVRLGTSSIINAEATRFDYGAGLLWTKAEQGFNFIQGFDARTAEAFGEVWYHYATGHFDESCKVSHAEIHEGKGFAVCSGPTLEAMRRLEITHCGS